MKVNSIHHAEIILHFENGEKVTYPCIVDVSFGVHKQPPYFTPPNLQGFIARNLPEIGTVHLEGTFYLGSQIVEGE